MRKPTRNFNPRHNCNAPKEMDAKNKAQLRKRMGDGLRLNDSLETSAATMVAEKPANAEASDIPNLEKPSKGLRMGSREFKNPATLT